MTFTQSEENFHDSQYFYCNNHCDLLATNDLELVKVNQPFPGESSVEKVNSADSPVLFDIFGLVFMLFFSVASWLYIAKIRKSLRDYRNSNSSNIKSKYSNSFASVPCHKCQYFSHNSYLKCAVNPSKVLQPEAKDCADYSSCPPRKFFGLKKNSR